MTVSGLRIVNFKVGAIIFVRLAMPAAGILNDSDVESLAEDEGLPGSPGTGIRPPRNFFSFSDIKDLLKLFCWAEKYFSASLIIYGFVGLLSARNAKPVSVCNTAILAGIAGLVSSIFGNYSLSQPKVRHFTAFHLFCSIISSVASLVSVVTASMYVIDLYEKERSPLLMLAHHIFILACVSEGVVGIMKAAFICKVWEIHTLQLDIAAFAQRTTCITYVAFISWCADQSVVIHTQARNLALFCVRHKLSNWFGHTYSQHTVLKTAWGSVVQTSSMRQAYTTGPLLLYTLNKLTLENQHSMVFWFPGTGKRTQETVSNVNYTSTFEFLFKVPYPISARFDMVQPIVEETIRHVPSHPQAFVDV